MAKLFSINGRRTASTPGKTLPGDAKILMFTGVRYERGTPGKPTTTIDPTTKRKRG
ncbi:hypothetical protein [Devosia sp. FKR38]|uniref:hypothetical protein n=1 Tax=Devosia sp. FKR38 TaxID=2562312 RepID=UPI0014853340|nr:hypothetical protein [Devosia sp. FKR38]